MAKQPNPQKVASLIRLAKHKAGMPGSDKMAKLKEVVITASPIKKKEPEAPVGLLSIAQFGGGSKTYLKDDVIKMLSDAGMQNEASAIKGLTSVRGDMSDVLNKLIGKKGIKAVTR